MLFRLAFSILLIFAIFSVIETAHDPSPSSIPNEHRPNETLVGLEKPDVVSHTDVVQQSTNETVHASNSTGGVIDWIKSKIGK